MAYIHHVLYKTGDKDAPDSIKDSNGEVVLGLCRICRRGESELEISCDGDSNLRVAGESIKVGDKMLVAYSGLGGSSSIHAVEKVYKRYFTCAGRKWSYDGRIMRCMGGNKWHRPRIRRAMPKDEEAIAERQRRHDVRHFDWNGAPQSIIDEIHNIITRTK